MGIQSGKNLNFEKCRTPDLGVPRKMSFGCNLVVNHKKIIRGKVVTSPKSKSCESYESMYAHDLYVHQKCFN
jgi:hypothetical protein